MDYTLCEYISPDFDILAFSLAKQFMVDSLNYPQQILDLEYNPRYYSLNKDNISIFTKQLPNR